VVAPTDDIKIVEIKAGLTSIRVFTGTGIKISTDPVSIVVDTGSITLRPEGRPGSAEKTPTTF
jgi:hypothetical protein